MPRPDRRLDVFVNRLSENILEIAAKMVAGGACRKMTI
jgi:hypothetical protein